MKVQANIELRGARRLDRLQADLLPPPGLGFSLGHARQESESSARWRGLAEAGGQGGRKVRRSVRLLRGFAREAQLTTRASCFAS